MGCQAGRCCSQSRGWIAIMEDSKHGGLGYLKILELNVDPLEIPSLRSLEGEQDSILHFWWFLTALFLFAGLRYAEPLGLIRKTYKGLLHRFPNPCLGDATFDWEPAAVLFSFWKDFNWPKDTVNQSGETWALHLKWRVDGCSLLLGERYKCWNSQGHGMMNPGKDKRNRRSCTFGLKNSPANSYLFLLGRAGWMRSHPQSRKAWNWSLPTWSMSFDFQRFRDDCTTVPAHNC